MPGILITGNWKWQYFWGVRWTNHWTLRSHKFRRCMCSLYVSHRYLDLRLERLCELIQYGHSCSYRIWSGTGGYTWFSILLQSSWYSWRTLWPRSEKSLIWGLEWLRPVWLSLNAIIAFIFSYTILHKKIKSWKVPFRKWMLV